ncbi:putative non-LTR retroelement reverse transcriptase, partial [Trifolium medium]|nr:putative non-LTR retroelement reverse transcriptase [Trifolium medium]
MEVAERVRVFVWLLKHNRLMTNARKHKMGLGSAACWWCNDTDETALHVLRDCPYAMALWMNT